MIETALICLALNVYFEARDQPMIGQYAVAETVINRMHSELFPDTICEVVTQAETYKWAEQSKNLLDKKVIRDRCQFSWFCDGLSDVPKDEYAWDVSLMVAHGVLNGLVDSAVEDSLWYHAHYVQPEWASSKRLVVRINDHIFYAQKQ
jgi:N-acetylmuramoyl-L-alanine amidase